MKRIHECLERALRRNRIVFWYDPASEWAEAFDAYADDGVVRLRVADNEFGTKVFLFLSRNVSGIHGPMAGLDSGSTLPETVNPSRRESIGEAHHECAT